MMRMHARGAFALTLMLLAPVGAAAQDADTSEATSDDAAPGADAEAAEAVEAPAPEATVDAEGDAPADAEADAGVDGAADPDIEALDRPDDGSAAPEPDDIVGPAPDIDVPAPTQVTAGSAEPAEGSTDEAAPLDAVAAPGPDPVGNATPPEYKPPNRTVDPAVAGLSRANGTNRWYPLESDGLRRELRLFVGSNNQSTSDASLDPFLIDEDRFTSGRFGVEAGLGNGLTVGATWAWGEDGRTIFDDVTTELELRGGDVFVRYAFEVAPVFLPYVQGEIGVRAVTARVRADDTSLSDDAMGLAYGAFAGFEVRYPLRNVSVGLFNEHGYQGSSNLAFDSARWNASDADPVDLGDLALTGYTWRMGLRLGVAF